MQIFSFTLAVQSDKHMQEFCVKQICFYSILMDQTLLDLTEPESDSVPKAYESQYWQHGEICIVRSTVKCAFHQVLLKWGTVVAQCLRCCATNRKVAVSIPAGIIGIFN